MEITQDYPDCFCLVCGGRINKKNHKNKYKCANCGETYNKDELEYIDMEMPTYDKQLLHSITKKPRDWK
jgi:tRNA(Ile2) C34 agmatinyltransferase TiaS